MKHLEVIENALLDRGNDKMIAKKILSFLYRCNVCKNYCVDVKKYYVKDCRNCKDFCLKDWLILDMCFECMCVKVIESNFNVLELGKIRFIEDELELAMELGIIF